MIWNTHININIIFPYLKFSKKTIHGYLLLDSKAMNGKKIEICIWKSIKIWKLFKGKTKLAFKISHHFYSHGYTYIIVVTGPF